MKHKTITGYVCPFQGSPCFDSDGRKRSHSYCMCGINTFFFIICQSCKISYKINQTHPDFFSRIIAGGLNLRLLVRALAM